MTTLKLSQMRGIPVVIGSKRLFNPLLMNIKNAIFSKFVLINHVNDMKQLWGREYRILKNAYKSLEVAISG